ncbi:hypothetical protein RCL_jg26371.t1 [Rhizophagus clarus]|uniref:Uncharacterized protein n=1 Tax=Rhizophagus clarus TaxID=94130 RepID=A0A8H3KZC6_9GLOM|nr:hypothetical protein RCL_jg26371.t1 [Rhizophagus clarus]
MFLIVTVIDVIDDEYQTSSYLFPKAKHVFLICPYLTKIFCMYRLNILALGNFIKRRQSRVSGFVDNFQSTYVERVTFWFTIFSMIPEVYF